MLREIKYSLKIPLSALNNVHRMFTLVNHYLCCAKCAMLWWVSHIVGHFRICPLLTAFICYNSLFVFVSVYFLPSTKILDNHSCVLCCKFTLLMVMLLSTLIVKVMLMLLPVMGDVYVPYFFFWFWYMFSFNFWNGSKIFRIHRYAHINVYKFVFVSQKSRKNETA